MRKWIIGIDLGGTTTKLAFITLEGEITYKWEIPTDKRANGENIVSDISTAINQKLNELNTSIESIIGIGMGCPGPVDETTGIVYEAINIGWTNYPLQEELSNATGMPVVIENDANIAALGEMWKGAGSGSKDLVCITLGTGVGGGVIVNGSLVSGANGAAGEIGHLTVVTEKGFRCNCGKTGCLETVASATGFVNLAMEHLDEHPESKITHILKHNGYITAKDVIDCAKVNDLYATEILNRVSFYLGMTLANVANVLNPEKIVIGGGVSKAGSILLENVRRFFEEYSFIRVKKSTQLSIATLGNDAGVIGAAWLVKSHLNE